MVSEKSGNAMVSEKSSNAIKYSTFLNENKIKCVNL